MIQKYGIVIVFVLMLSQGVWGVVLSLKLRRYMDSPAWTVKRWISVFLAVAQIHGISKTIWSDHHFNSQDFLFFLELLIVFVGLNISDYLRLQSWRKFPYFQKRNH